jgi:peptide/nickel transport system substrate-binding protein
MSARRLLLFLILCLPSSTVVAQPPDAAPGQTCTLTYVENGRLTRVFPYYYGGAAADRRVVDLLFEPLVREGTGASMQSLILDLHAATSREEGMEWSYPLRPFNWHTGKPVTLDQIVRTFQELKRLGSEGLTDWAQELRYFREMSSMKAEGNNLVVRYTHPLSREEAEASLQNFYVIPWDDLARLSYYKDQLEVYVPLASELNRGLVGNGRWQAVAGTGMITDEGGIQLSSAETFPGGTNPIEEVRSRVQPIPGRRVELFRNGAVNVVLDVPPVALSEVEEINGAITFPQSQNSFTFIIICNRNPALSDPRVREAMIYAVDRKAILRDKLGDQGSLIEAPYPPNSLCYNETVPERQYDPARCARLLREAGFVGDPSSGWSKGGMTLDGLTFLLPRTLEGGEDQEIVKAVCDYLGEAGIHVEMEDKDAQLVDEALQNGDYDFYLDTYISGNGWFLRPVLSRNVKGRPGNKFFYCSDEVEALLERYEREAVNKAKVSEIGKEIHAAIYRSADRIYLWSPKRTGVFSSSEIRFQTMGLTLFEAPALWRCVAQ